MTLLRNYFILFSVVSCLKINSTLQMKNEKNGIINRISSNISEEENHISCEEDNLPTEIIEWCTNTTNTIHICDSNVIKSIPNVVLAVLAMVGNGLVIYFSVRGWAVTPRFRKLICGMALSDFMFGLMLLIYSIPGLWTCYWVYGRFMCSVIPSALLFCANLGIGFFVIIAIDRFIGIIFPFRYCLSKKRIWILIYLNIALAVGSVVPQSLTQEISMFNTCLREMPKKYSRIYSWFLFIVYYLIPIILSSAVNIILIVWLRKAQINTKALNDEQQRIRQKANRNIKTVLISITFFFGILVMPNKVIWIIKEEFDLVNFSVDEAKNIKMVSDVFYSFHAVVNPLIYAFADETFRNRLKAMFCFKMIIRRGFKSSLSMLSTRTLSATQLSTPHNFKENYA